MYILYSIRWPVPSTLKHQLGVTTAVPTTGTCTTLHKAFQSLPLHGSVLHGKCLIAHSVCAVQWRFFEWFEMTSVVVVRAPFTSRRSFNSLVPVRFCWSVAHLHVATRASVCVVWCGGDTLLSFVQQPLWLTYGDSGHVSGADDVENSLDFYIEFLADRRSKSF